MATESPSNIVEFSVSEISNALRRTVEDAYSRVRVRGEISGYRGPHSSGHAYFALKDDKARLEAVIWRGAFGKLRFRPEEGMEVIATGKLTTYPGSSKYQIVIDELEPAGAGALMAMLEERRKRLAAEGLFDAARKQLLPFLPRAIGVVTSPTGAVIRDIIHRISDRFALHVLVWPVRVQGETTGAEVSAAIAGFNALEEGGPIPRPDVIIVARGGGSLEDLWGFNDETVARAAAASDIPLISAVGHETDWTLIDHAADVRAPTPTAAAELAVPVKAELQAQIASLGARLAGAISRAVERKRQGLRGAARGLPSPDQLLALPRRRFDEAAVRLGRGLAATVAAKRARFDARAARLTPHMLRQSLARRRDRMTAIASRIDVAAGQRLVRRRDRLGATVLRLRPALLERIVRQRRDSARPLARALPVAFTRIGERLAQGRTRVADANRRADRASDQILATNRADIETRARLLKSLSHEAVLERGFALVRDPDGKPLKRAAEVSSGMALSLQFSDGDVQAVAGGGGKPRASKGGAPKAQSQGSLF